MFLLFSASAFSNEAVDSDMSSSQGLGIAASGGAESKEFSLIVSQDSLNSALEDCVRELYFNELGNITDLRAGDVSAAPPLNGCESDAGDPILMTPDPLSFSLSGALVRMGVLGQVRDSCQHKVMAELGVKPEPDQSTYWSTAKQIGNASLINTGKVLYTTAEFVKAGAKKYGVNEKLGVIGSFLAEKGVCAFDYGADYLFDSIADKVPYEYIDRSWRFLYGNRQPSCHLGM